MSYEQKNEILKPTCLIQRLEKPVGDTSPFDFGVGGSGLKESTEELISKIWSWDYMGAFEYENGSVQRAMETIQCYSIDNRAFTGNVEVGDHKLVYLLCEDGTESGVEKRINQLYNDERELYLKRPALFKDSIDKIRATNIIGWLELDNGFIFFKNKTAYNKALKLFGINPKK
jgi:hypothetical protein